MCLSHIISITISYLSVSRFLFGASLYYCQRFYQQIFDKISKCTTFMPRLSLLVSFHSFFRPHRRKQKCLKCVVEQQNTTHTLNTAFEDYWDGRPDKKLIILQFAFFCFQGQNLHNLKLRPSINIFVQKKYFKKILCCF